MATTSVPLDTQPWTVEQSTQLLAHFEVNSVWPYWGLILAVILAVGHVITRRVLCICLCVDILVIDLENIKQNNKALFYPTITTAECTECFTLELGYFISKCSLRDLDNP